MGQEQKAGSRFYSYKADSSGASATRPVPAGGGEDGEIIRNNAQCEATNFGAVAEGF